MVILCQAEKACYWRPHIIWFLSYEMSRTEISGFLALEWGWRVKRWQTKNIKFLLFSFLLFAALPDVWDLNSLTKVQTCASCIESVRWTTRKVPKISFWSDANVLKLTVMLVGHIRECIENHWIIHFKWMNYMIYELYLNKDIRKRKAFSGDPLLREYKAQIHYPSIPGSSPCRLKLHSNLILCHFHIK